MVILNMYNDDVQLQADVNDIQLAPFEDTVTIDQ